MGQSKSQTTITHAQELEAFSKALANAEDQVIALRRALTQIKVMKSEPIRDTGFSVGPASLFANCQRIAREALKNV